MATFKYFKENSYKARVRRSRAFARGVCGQYMNNLSISGQVAANSYLQRTAAAVNAVDALYRFYRAATGTSMKVAKKTSAKNVAKVFKALSKHSSNLHGSTGPHGTKYPTK